VRGARRSGSLALGAAAIGDRWLPVSRPESTMLRPPLAASLATLAAIACFSVL